MSAGVLFSTGKHEALQDSWASSINADVLWCEFDSSGVGPEPPNPGIRVCTVQRVARDVFSFRISAVKSLQSIWGTLSESFK